MGTQLLSGTNQGSEAVGLIQTQAKKSPGGSKEHPTVQHTRQLALLWFPPCLPTNTASHPSMAETNDALAGFLHAFAVPVSLLITSAQTPAIYLPRVNSRDLQGITTTHLRPKNTQIFHN